MHGYFEGDIDGMGNEAITDGDYGAKGDMTLDDNGPPFEFMISSRMINNMFHVVLAHNKIEKDASYDTIMATNFPFDWTST